MHYYRARHSDIVNIPEVLAISIIAVESYFSEIDPWIKDSLRCQARKGGPWAGRCVKGGHPLLWWNLKLCTSSISIAPHRQLHKHV